MQQSQISYHPLDRLGGHAQTYTGVALVTDRNVNVPWGGIVEAALHQPVVRIVVPAGEVVKYAMISYGVLVPTLALLPYSRLHESEADRIGLMYMAKAGYDPTESIKLWERMGAANQGKAPAEWMSTHPSEEHRKENLSAWLPEAQRTYSSAPHKYGVGEAIR